MTDEIEFRVWIGCLACYNNGGLVGQWYDASEAGDVTVGQVHELTAEPPSGWHEELWCFDIEAPHPSLAREMSPMEAHKIYEQIEEAREALSNCPWQAFVAYAGNQHADLDWDMASEAEDHYRGEFDSFRDYADEYADEWLGVPSTPCDGRVWDDAMRELGDRMEFAVRHFDYAGHARDFQMGHTVFDAPGGGVYVFSD